jgi:hypothetical protein
MWLRFQITALGVAGIIALEDLWDRNEKLDTIKPGQEDYMVTKWGKFMGGL